MTEYITAVSSMITAGIAIWLFFYGRHQRRFDIMEQSFDVLQRINEKALENDQNVMAAVLSANPEDKMTADDARIIYFHYMRINRIFRAYEYHLGGFISSRQRDRIARPQIRTLVSVKDKLPEIIQRGYPKDYLDYLMTELAEVKLPDKINQTE